MAKIVFVDGQNPQASQREKELARAQARSHASRVSHENRRAHQAKGLIHIQSSGSSAAAAAEASTVRNRSHRFKARAGSASSAGTAPTDEVRDESPFTGSERSWFSDESTLVESSPFKEESPPLDAGFEVVASSSSSSLVALPQPSSLLARGNSDPFQAFPIAVNSRTNQVLSFLKDAYLPSIYRVDRLDRGGTSYASVAAHTEWSNITKTLHVESSGLAVLYKYLSIMAKVAPEGSFAAEKLSFKSQASRALRVFIQKNPAAQDTILEGAMNLFSAEMFAGNRDEATIHGRMVHRILSQMYQTGGRDAVDREMLRRALYNDAYLATLHMGRPIFPLDGWVMDFARPLLAPIDEALDPVRTYMLSTLDGSVDSEPMRSLLVSFRLAMAVWFRKLSLPAEFNRAAAVQWIFAQTNIIHNRVLHHYMDMRAQLLEVQDVPNAFDPYALHYAAQCCLTLGIIYYIPQYAGDPTIAGRPILGCTKTTMAHLRETLSVVLPDLLTQDFDLDSDALRGYANIYLWALFLGAQAEWSDPTCLNPSKSWFGHKFRELAATLGLWTWPEVKERVSRYIDNEWFKLEPPGSSWVPQLLEREPLPRDVLNELILAVRAR